ncbi:MAG: two-component system response regulator [Paenibacillaceae bacterium]|jgi:two-component system response regulator YesN|nr:two-component system response regulator [Paenibacillaceae bacterium]
MNLMIVEDEVRIRNGIAGGIPWEQSGIEIVALAGSGKEALDMMERRKPDIILLDIEMPEMDGLELAEEVLRQEPQMKLVILSGHNDFHYAQRAIELGVMKYLLKPAGDQEILEAVTEAAREIREKLMEKHNMDELKRLWESRLPQLQNDFFRNWILNRYEEWEWRKHAGELNLSITGHTRFLACICEIDPLAEEETRFSAADSSLLQFSLECIAKEFMASPFCRVFNDANGSTVVLFFGQQSEPDTELMKRANIEVSRLLKVVEDCLKLTASAGLGTVFGSTEVFQSYRQARRALQDRTVYGHAIAIPYLEVKKEEGTFDFNPSFERQLEIAIQTEEVGQAYALIEEHLGQVFRHATAELVHEHVLYLSSIFTRFIQSRGFPMKKVLHGDYRIFRSLETLTTQSQILEWTKRVAGQIWDYMDNERRQCSHEMVKNILESVEQHLGEDLSLHSFSERLFVNPSYLSRLFKKETGESFSNYVLGRRMERAKELLAGNVKVYDAANAVGYQDMSYFAKVFRKYWGVAPRELKK